MMNRERRGLVSDWFWTIDRYMLATFIALIGLGFMLSFAASPGVAERLDIDHFHFVKRHALFIAPALVIMISLSFLTPRQVRRWALVLLAISIAMMVFTQFYGFEAKGSRRWFSIAGFSVQSSEFLKPAFIIICAWLFSEHSRNPDIPGNLFAIILYAIVVALLVAQPDFGQTILVTITWGALFFMAGIPWFWIALLAFMAVGMFVTAYLTLPHVAARIDRFLTGEGDTHQVDTAREAIVRGDWFGQGPGEGTIKRILPDSHTDFIYSVAAEEFGILFCMALALIFFFIVFRGLKHANREGDEFTRLAIAGLTLLVGLQSTIHIGVNLELLPAKGMTLPLISYGGSSMLAISITAGFLLALTRRNPEKRASGRQKRFVIRPLATEQV